jgi:hypothetical protein
MAELAVGGPGGIDVLALGGNWVAISDSLTPKQNVVHTPGATGDVILSDTWGSDTEGTVTYRYNAETNISDDASLPLVGSTTNSYKVTEMKVDYSDTERPTVVFTIHNHTANGHDADGATFTPTIDLPGTFGCPELLTNSNSTTCAPKKASYTIKAEHVDVNDGDGDHLVGADYGGMETLSLDHVGTPSLTTTGWVVTSTATSRSNTEFTTVSTTLEKTLTRDA